MLSPWAKAQNCKGELTVNLVGSLTGESLSVDVESRDIACLTDNDSYISLIVNGGNPSYTYSWADDLTSDSTRTLLDDNFYFVTVTDDEGCSKTVEKRIHELSPNITELADSDGCGVCTVPENGESYFFDSNGKYIAALVDASGNNSTIGNTEVCVFMDDQIQICSNNNSPYMQRHWTIDPANDVSSSVKLFFTEQELSDLGSSLPSGLHTAQQLIDQGKICLTAFTGGQENCNDYESAITYSQTDAVPLIINLEDAIKGIYSVVVQVENLSNFFLHSCEMSLPVELVYFKGEKQEKSNLLFWETATEENVSHFELEKRTALQNQFSRLASIGAAGFSVEPQFYNYVDEHPSTDLDYYRLKIIDLDESFEYSDIVVIDRTKQVESKVYPNSFESEIFYETFLSQSGKLEVVIYDALGRVALNQVFQLKGGTHKLRLNLKDLPPAHYYMQVRKDSYYLTEAFKLVKVLSN